MAQKNGLKLLFSLKEESENNAGKGILILIILILFIIKMA
jgi:hypothetical protein